MITLSEEKPCVDLGGRRIIKKKNTALQKEPKNTLEHQLQYYIEKQYQFDEELRKDCPVEDEKLEIPKVVEELSPDAQIM